MDRRITTLQFLEVCSPPVAEVFHYWDHKRGGRVMPSRSDIEMTKDVQKAAAALGLAVHDHIVIGRDGHASLRTLGLM